MIFDSRTYRVLVVSSYEKFNRSLPSYLPESVYCRTSFADSIAAARRAVLEERFDFVIVNAPLPDDVGTRFAIDISEWDETVCLMLIRSDLHEELNARVAPHGVFTLAKPLSPVVFTQAVRWLVSARERLRSLGRKTDSAEQKIEEIRLVNRAKWLLIEHRGMSEEAAHHHIERQAMDRCLPKKTVAEQILHEYL